MKKLISLTTITLLALTIIGCRKDKTNKTTPPTVETENPLVCDTCSERHFEAFGEYQIYNKMTITYNCKDFQSKINQEFNYRLVPAQVIGENHFYEVYRKGKYNYDIGAYEVGFALSDGLYRYDYENQKAYHYSDVNDPSPKLLMDFNHEIGDVVPLDIDKEIDFVVQEKDTFLLGGYPLPRLIGKVINENRPDPDNIDQTTILTPFYPNPVHPDYSLSYYYAHDWQAENFEDWGTYVFENVYVSDFECQLFSKDDDLISHTVIWVE